MNWFTNVTKTLVSINKFNNTYQNIRWKTRWNSRRPVRVIPAEEYDEQLDTVKQTTKLMNTEMNDAPVRDSIELENNKIGKFSSKIKWKQPNSQKDQEPKIALQYRVKAQKPLTISKSNQTKSTTVDMLETIIDADGNFIYTKMKNNDSRITSILVEVKSKKEKEKKDLILLEGKRLIKDALEVGCKLEYIIFSRLKDVEYLRPSLPKIGAKMYKMPYREMQMWSGLTTNPGIMGVFKIPDIESYKPPPDSLPITVICDNVREANNLGAILRTCSGVGCQNLLLTRGCVNVWDSKVLRSACGAHFKLQIRTKLDWNNIKELVQPDSSIFVADNQTLTTDTVSEKQDLADLIQAVPILPYYGVDFRTANHVVLIIGGETEGISVESYQLAAEFKGVRLNVPLSNNVDSLNTGTALGVIAFEIKRQILTT